MNGVWVTTAPHSLPHIPHDALAPCTRARYNTYGE